MSDSIMNNLRSELIKAENIIDSEYNFSHAEPTFLRCLQIIENAPDRCADFISLFDTLLTTKQISVDSIAFLMHKLRWPEVLHGAQHALQQMPNRLLTGGTMMKIIAAFEDGWKDRIFYKTFSDK